VAEGSRAQPPTIGQRIRAERSSRCISLAKLAALTGLSKGYLSRVENGERTLDRRRTLLDVADALRVPVAALTGQPYTAEVRNDSIVRTAVTDIRDALQGTELGDRYEEAGRDLDTLRHLTDRALRLSCAAAFQDLGPMLPGLITDLHAHAGGTDEQTVRRALPILVDALYAAQWMTKCAGENDLAWLAAERALAVARASEDPTLIGFAQFLRAQSLLRVGGRARFRAAAVASSAARELQPLAGPGPAGEVYGSLHLTAAWAQTVAGQPTRADEHLVEAGETAARTGDGRSFDLWFGPNNTRVWLVSMAVERGEGGRVLEMSRDIDQSALPSRGRRANHFLDIGRGLAQEPRTRPAAIDWYRRAERLAPMIVRMDPFVRESVGELLHTDGGTEVRALAKRMGLVPTG
jgi:transcriptional regulator with XRE-family HTH domain